MPVTLDSIKAATVAKVTPIEVPEWGGTVYIRALSAAEAAAYADERQTVRGEDGEESTTAHLRNICLMLVRVLCKDELGSEELFPDHEGGMDMLGDMPQALLFRLFAEVQQANAMEAEAVKELAGNFNGGRDAASPSDSLSQ